MVVDNSREAPDSIIIIISETKWPMNKIGKREEREDREAPVYGGVWCVFGGEIREYAMPLDPPRWGWIFGWSKWGDGNNSFCDGEEVEKPWWRTKQTQ